MILPVEVPPSCPHPNPPFMYAHKRALTQAPPPPSLSPANTLACSGVFVSAISLGGYHSCALVTGGTIKCWGRNAAGELGIGNTADQLRPVDVDLGAGVCACLWVDERWRRRQGKVGVEVDENRGCKGRWTKVFLPLSLAICISISLSTHAHPPSLSPRFSFLFLTLPSPHAAYYLTAPRGLHLSQV